MIKYLLECSCGEKIPVTTSQADQTVPCPSCGKELQVPTLLKLRQLESIEYEPSRADHPSNWGTVQKLMTICVFLVLLSGGWLAFALLYNRPPAPKEFYSQEKQENFEKAVSDMSLLSTFKLWGFLQHDIRLKWRDDHNLEVMRKAYNVRVTTAFILVGTAVLITIMTWIFTRRATPKPDPMNPSP